MNLRRVPRQLTEDSVISMRATCANYLRESSSPLSYGRFMSTHMVSDVTSDSGAQSAYLRIVGISESYVDALFAEVLRERLPGHSDIARTALAEIEMQASLTWQNREDAFANYFGVNIRSGFSDFHSAVDVRNIIAHGLGRVTPKLFDKPGLRSKLKGVDVAVRDRRIIIGDRSVVKCEEVCRFFVTTLDSRL